MIENFWEMIQTIIVAMVAVPWLGVTLPFIIIFSFCIIRHTEKAMRETTRLTAITNSPLISYVGETT